MSRIEIKLPEKFIFSMDIPVRISDTNRGGHIAFNQVLSFAEEARVPFLESIGYPEQNVSGIAYIFADVGVIYKKQGFYKQTLRVEVGIGDLSEKGCDLIFKISNSETGEEMYRVKIGMLFFDYRQQKVIAVPDEFKRKVAARVS